MVANASGAVGPNSCVINGYFSRLAGRLAGEGENRQSSVTSEGLISSKPAPVSRTQDTKQEGHPSSVPLSSFTSQLETCSVMCVPLISTTSIKTRVEGLQIPLIEV